MCCDNLWMSWREIWISSWLRDMLRVLIDGSIAAWMTCHGTLPLALSGLTLLSSIIGLRQKTCLLNLKM